MRNSRCWKGYGALLEAYSRQPIVVFAGAGATLDPTPSEESYGVGTWFDLLDKIVDKVVEANNDENLRRQYPGQRKQLKDDPWELAEWISQQVNLDQPGTPGTSPPSTG